MRGRWELSDAQWELIEPLLRPKRRTDGRGRPWQNTRAVLNGILWVLGTGARCGPGHYLAADGRHCNTARGRNCEHRHA